MLVKPINLESILQMSSPVEGTARREILPMRNTK